MEFHWTPAQQRFREEVRTALDDLLPPDWETLARNGPGSTEQLDFSRSFCPRLAERGLLTPHWAPEWGGRGMGPWEHLILNEEMWAIGEPRGGQYMNVNWIGPALMRYGTSEQKDMHLPPIREGAVIWCQGFSEPNAGADLAALTTSARRSGDGYVINGTKIWTSYAQRADYCFLLARTAPGKQGVGVFLVPMDIPGVEVRDIPGIIGGGGFHEVFFTDVGIPESARLGAEGQGWEVVTHALQYERVGSPRYARAQQVLSRAVAELKRAGCWQEGAMRDRAAQALADCEAARLLVYRVIDDRAKLRDSGAATNLARVAQTRAERAVNDFVIDGCGAHLAGGDAGFEAYVRLASSAPLAAGPTEIQLDLVARHLLQLPRGH